MFERKGFRLRSPEVAELVLRVLMANKKPMNGATIEVRGSEIWHKCLNTHCQYPSDEERAVVIGAVRMYDLLKAKNYEQPQSNVAEPTRDLREATDGDARRLEEIPKSE